MRLGWVAALALLSAACGNNAPPATTQTPVPTTVRIGWAGSPDSLNPGVARLAEAQTLFTLVYDTLYSLQLDGKIHPALAERATRTEDGKVWTYQIKRGVKFHDGQPLSARDVAFSFDFYQRHPEFPYLHGYTRGFERIEAPSDDRVVLSLAAAVPNLESRLAYLYVLPEHLWKSYAQGEDAGEFGNAALIGSGPFRLVEYQPNQFIRLAANRDHPWLAPKIGEAIFQTFANPDALVQALRTGQVDMITELPNTAVASLGKQAQIQVISGTPLAPGVTDILINQITPERCPPNGRCTGHPALRDRVVRRALAHAVDKRKLIDVALLGLGVPGLTLVPQGLGDWYNGALADYPYDPAAANRLLDEAGYRDHDGDGVREMPDGGRPLSFRLYWASDSTIYPRMAELLSAMWRAIGVKTELQTLDPDALSNACCPGFDYDLIVWGWGSDPDPDLVLGAMASTQIASGGNETGYANPAYDALYARQATELDPGARRALVWEMQRIVLEDVVYIVPFYEQDVQAYRTDRFQGWPRNAARVALEHASSLAAIEPVR
ncbi:MAG: ABC transporter substrate-binding protein [Gammaproteobacteria bacterium]